MMFGDLNDPDAINVRMEGAVMRGGGVQLGPPLVCFIETVVVS